MTEKNIPWVVHGTTMPEPVAGFKWKPIKNNPFKPQQIEGWKRVAIKVSSEPVLLKKPEKVAAQNFSFKLPDLPVKDDD